MVHLTFQLSQQQWIFLSTDAGYALSCVVFDYCAIKTLLQFCIRLYLMLYMAYPRKSTHASNTNITQRN